MSMKCSRSRWKKKARKKLRRQARAKAETARIDSARHPERKRRISHRTGRSHKLLSVILAPTARCLALLGMTVSAIWRPPAARFVADSELKHGSNRGSR